jgi:membrane-associated phospholipid phosphatase
LKGSGRAAARPLLPPTARPLAVAIVVVCVLVTAVQGVWLRHGMETGRVDTAVDAKVLASLGGHPVLLAVLVWPGAPVAVTAMAAALVLACIRRRRYGEAAFVAVSVPLATAITQLVLKPLIGRTPWGNPFPSGHVTSVVALATALTVLLAGAPAMMPRLLRLVLAFTAFLIAAAVAVGVIGANMHHFTDTVGGADVGTGTVLLTALVLDLISQKSRRLHDRPLLIAVAQDRDSLQPSRPDGGRDNTSRDT